MYIKVRVVASAKKEFLKQKNGDHFNITVREPAKHNLANHRVLELIAAHYKIPTSKVRLVSGHHSPSKILFVDLLIKPDAEQN